jgi:hypothetical protein
MLCRQEVTVGDHKYKVGDRVSALCPADGVRYDGVIEEFFLSSMSPVPSQCATVIKSTDVQAVAFPPPA